MDLSGMGIGLGISQGNSVPYSAEAVALFSRFTTPPSVARKGLINALVVALKGAGIWSKLDALYVMAAADAQAAQRNWISDAFNALPQNAPTFTADRGYAGNGSTSYLDTGFNPTTATTPKLTRNDAHMGLWSRTNSANGAGFSFDAGNTNSFNGRHASTSGLAQARPNLGVLVNAAAGGYPGHVIWSRTAAGAWASYAAGAAALTGTDASVALSNENFGIGKVTAAAFGVNQAAAFHFGSQLTAADAGSLYAAIHAYLVGAGAA